MTTRKLEHDIHLWAFEQLQPSLHAPMCSNSEIRRAEQSLNREKAAIRLQSRQKLRQVLATYLPESKKKITFNTLISGKPYLKNNPTIHFSLSHSKDTAIIAVAPYSIGVDIEHPKTLAQPTQLAQKLFTQEEWLLWQKLSNKAQIQALFSAWVRKEACIKCFGLRAPSAFKKYPTFFSPYHIRWEQDCSLTTSNPFDYNIASSAYFGHLVSTQTPDQVQLFFNTDL
jgi:phosphopantetheinyl transferase